VAQVVGHLLSKCKTLSSNPTTVKKKKIPYLQNWREKKKVKLVMGCLSFLTSSPRLDFRPWLPTFIPPSSLTN
jgi:hypothetical protein